MPQYPICDHIKANGNTCESPAIKDSQFCYFHSRDRQRLRNLQQARDLKNHRRKGHFTEDDFSAEILESLDLPLLEDGAAIQVALSGVLRAIAGHHIAERRGALLLYGLQIAVSNVTHVRLKLLDTDPFALTDPEPIEHLNRLADPRTWLAAEEEQEEEKVS